MIWLYLLIAIIALAVGFTLGLWRGAKLGVRIFAKDAITLAFRTLDSNPEMFARMKDEALGYPEHEEWIQKTIDRAIKPKPETPREEWEREKKRLHDAGIY